MNDIYITCQGEVPGQAPSKRLCFRRSLNKISAEIDKKEERKVSYWWKGELGVFVKLKEVQNCHERGSGEIWGERGHVRPDQREPFSYIEGDKVTRFVWQKSHSSHLRNGEWAHRQRGQWRDCCAHSGQRRWCDICTRVCEVEMESSRCSLEIFDRWNYLFSLKSSQQPLDTDRGMIPLRVPGSKCLPSHPTF